VEVMKHSDELSFDGPFDDEGRPVLITAAATPYEEQHRQRVRRYLQLMFWRVPALLLAWLAYGIWENGLISLAIIAVSIPLPWMAVLIANDRPPRRPEEPRRYDAARRARAMGVAPRPALEQPQQIVDVPPDVPQQHRPEAGGAVPS